MRTLYLVTGLMLALCLGAATMSQNNVQVFSPNGLKARSLTGVGYVATDLSKATAARLIPYSSANGFVRHLASAGADKSGYVKTRIFADTPYIFGINAATPFPNISGVKGTLEVM